MRFKYSTHKQKPIINRPPTATNQDYTFAVTEIECDLPPDEVVEITEIPGGDTFVRFANPQPEE